MRRLATAGLVLLVGLAACLEGPREVPCEGADCPGPSPSPSPEWVVRPPGSPFPPVPVNESLRSMRLEGCVGIGANLYMNYAKVDELVPDDFDLQEIDGGFARFALGGFQCERAVLPGRVLPEYRELFLGPFVYPKNASWQPGERVGHYLFEYYVNDAAVAEFLSSLGIPARVGTFQVETTPLLAANLQRWTVAENETRFLFEFYEMNTDTGGSNATLHRWTGSSPYLRATETSDYSFTLGQDRGLVRVEGPSKTAQVMDGPATYWSGGLYYRMDYSLVIDASLFGGAPD